MATTGKMAIQRLVIGEDGRSRLMLIDLQTFEPVVDPTEYTIIGATTPPEPEEVEDVDQPDANPIQAQRTEPPEGLRGEGASGNANATPSAGYAQPSSSRARDMGVFPSAPSLPGQTRTQAALSSPRAQAPMSQRPSTPQSTAPATPATRGGFVPSANPETSVSYAGIGPNRSRAVSPETESRVADAVGGTLGRGSTVAVTSGDVNPEDPGWTAKGPKGQPNHYSKSHRHTDELGMDFKAIDPMTGQPTRDRVAIADMAMAAAAKNPSVGIGFGKNYMGDETMHMDFSGKGGIWGGGFTQEEIDNINLGRESRIGPTPYRDAPTPTPSPGFVNAGRVKDDFVGVDPFDAASPLSGNTAPTVGQIEARSTVSSGIIGRAKEVAPSENKMAGTRVGNMTPAEFANAGFTNRTLAERQAIGLTIAGEMTRSQLEALSQGVPQAQAEFANIVATVENRAASVKTGLAGVLTPNNYNSLMNTPLNGQVPLSNSKALFSQYNPTVMGALNSYYTGKIAPTQPAATHYYNAEIVDPAWSSFGSFAQTGQHTFGSLPGEYTPGSAFEAERSRMGAAQVSDTRGFTPSDSARGFAGRDAESRGTFGTSSSPGVGRSSIDSGGGFASRSDRGTFGTSSSPGVGRSSIGGGGNGGSTSSGSKGGVSSSSGSRSGGIGSDRGASSAGGSSGSKGTGTGRDGRTGSSGSPTNDGKGGSKSPGGGF